MLAPALRGKHAGGGRLSEKLQLEIVGNSRDESTVQRSTCLPPKRCKHGTWRVVPLDRSQADGAGRLHARSRELGLSYADCACLALAEARGWPVLTGDRKWTRIDVPVEVRLFR